jgi:parvulin-like peptidyl-prolyl isomerase
MEASTAASAGRPARWIFGLVSLAAVAAVALGIRTLAGPTSASAQTPTKTPAARPTVPITKRPTAQQPATKVPTARPSTGTAKAPATAGATASQPAAGRTPPPINSLKVMAVVNAEPISRQDLGYQCLRRYGEEVLESLVNKQLINEALKERGIQISDKDVALEIDRIAAKFNLPTDRWLALLREERGFTESQYRREVVWPMLALRKLSAAEVQVTKEELQKAFESEYGPKVRARMIILPTLKEAQTVHAQAVADPSKFGELARKGEDPNIAAASGVIPPIGLHMGSPEIEKAAFALNKGEISQPIAVANKFVILYCEDRIPEQYVATQNLPLIDKQLTEKLREEKIRRASSEFFAKMQESSKIENVWNDPAKRKAQPGVAATINGKPITIEQLQSECLERHGAEVLEGEINRKILTQELARRKIAVTQQDLDAEIARAAESYGIFKKGTTTEPDVEAWLAQVTAHDGATVDIYQDDAVWPSVALKRLVGDKVQVTDEDLQKGFESSYGERVEVLAIVLGDQRQAQRVWDDLRKTPTQAYFEEQAENYSIEPASRANRGKVPPIRRHSGGGAIEQEAFKLKAGELSSILAVDDQFVILRCVGRTKPVQVDFESVKANLYKDIHEKKIRVEMNNEFDRLLAAAQIDNYVTGASQAGRRTAASAGPAAPATKGSSKLSPIRSGSVGTAPSATSPSKPKTTR